MHPEADAFLDAIFDHPDDDAPRLVYADWLQEHGQENYARFIRLQCAAAREKMWSDEANRLWEEIGRVWNALRYEWWPATVDVWQLPGSVSAWDRTANAYVMRKGLRLSALDAMHFHRGFLRSGIPLTCTQAVRYSEFWPSIISSDACLTLNDDHFTLIAIASDPILRHVRRVRCSTFDEYSHDYPHPYRSICHFLSSPHLRRVRVLDFVGTALDRSAIEVLFETDKLPQVEEVRLRAFDDRAYGRVETIARLRNRFKRVVIK